jgi:UDP-GlcNAc:undecaprenyl-phosphate GlcNAc-1-phosphate transferase
VISVALIVLLLGLGSSLLLTPIAARLATRRGWLDYPDGRRKLHTVPVPRVGGLAVYAAFLIAFGVLVATVPEAVSDGPGVVNAYLHLALACGAVMLVGFLDDVVGVPPVAKITVQALAAAYLFFHGYRIESLTNPLGDPLRLGSLSLPLTLLWFVAMSNAFNLIDGVDGLAAGVAFLATASLFAAASLGDHWETAFLVAALAGALLGFLRYNFSPASIFMGDCGSLFVGFALAAFALRGFMKTSAAIAVSAPLLALALPILDVIIAVARRFIAGNRVFEGDRQHIHHRLLRMGLTPRAAVVSLYGVAALCASLSLVTMTGRVQVLWAVAIASALLTWVGIQQLGYVEFSEVQRVLVRRLLTERRTLANNVQLLELRNALAKAADLAELWDALVECGTRLGLGGLRLVLAPEWRARSDRRLGAEHPGHPFPVWWRDGKVNSAEERWRWVIALGEDSTRLGEMTVTPGTSDARGLDFDPAYLIETVANDFTRALIRVLSSDAEPGRTVRTPAGPVDVGLVLRGAVTPAKVPSSGP